VPTKDVKTFLRALKAVTVRYPEASGWIVGPLTEEPGYAAECLMLASSLDLDGRVRFVGSHPPEEVLARLGLLVLSSVRETLPPVVLEAFASGLPVVATDVGACRELVEGGADADRELGPAGAIVPRSDPGATARAALELLRDPDRWRSAQRAAVRRAETYYTQRQTIEAYRRIYGEAMARPA